MRTILTSLIFSIIITVIGLSAFAAEYRLGELVIENPIARETPPGAKVAAGYLVIKNEGTASDRLVGGQAAFAGNVEIHEMKMNAGVMQMRQIEGGLLLPSGEEVKLNPGGYHIMFTGVTEPLKKGEQREIELTFEKAGKIKVVFEVKSIAETMMLKHNH